MLSIEGWMSRQVPHKNKESKKKGRPPAFKTQESLERFAALYNKGLCTVDLMHLCKIKRTTACKYINLIKQKNLVDM